MNLSFLGPRGNLLAVCGAYIKYKTFLARYLICIMLMTAIITERKGKLGEIGMDGQRSQLWGVELMLTPPDVGM